LQQQIEAEQMVIVETTTSYAGVGVARRETLKKKTVTGSYWLVKL